MSPGFSPSKVPQPAAQIEDLIRSLAASEAALEAALPDQVDAVINPATATPILLHRAQAALQASETRYRHLLSRMSAIVFELEPNGTILYVNDTVRQATGFPAQELLGKNWWETFFPGEQRSQADALQARLKQGDVSNYELTLTIRSGALITLELNSANHYHPDGTLERCLGLGVDITERKRAEQDLLKERNLLSTLIDNLPDAVYVKDLQGRIILDNVRNRRNLTGGAGPEETLGKTDFDFHAREMAEQYYAEEQAVIHSGHALVDHEERTIDALGNRGWHLTSKVPLNDAAGLTIGLVGISRDITERKQAEETLRQSEERFAKIFQRSPVAISISSLDDGRFLDFNESFIRLSGYSREEIMGHTAAELQLWIDPDQRRSMFQALRDRGSVFGREAEYRTKSGDVLTVLASMESLTLQGQLCVLFIGHNITERKQAEETIRQSEERFASVFRLSPVGIALTAAVDGRYLDINDSLLNLLGYSREEMLGRTAEELNIWLAPEHRAAVVRTLGEEGSVHGLEIGFRTKTGAICTTLTSIELVFMDGQSCLLSIVYDITERKKAQIALHDSELRFRAIFDQAAVGMIQSTTDGRWLLVNKRFCEMLGYSEQELVNHALAEFTHPDDLALQWEQTRQVLTGERLTFSMEKRYIRKDGAYLWANNTSSLVRSEADNTDYFVAIIEDITNRKQAEEILRQSEERFASVFRLSPVGISISTVAEGRYIDLNNSLLNLLGYTREEMLGRTADELNVWGVSDQRAEMARTVREEGAVRGLEIGFRTKTGEIRTTLTSVELVVLNGQACFLGMIYDITERKKVEDAEREQRMLAEALSSAAAALTSTLDPNLVMVRILDSLDKVVPHDFAIIMLIEGNIARAVHRHGYSPDVDRLLAAYPFHVNEMPYLRQMRASGQPCLVADTEADPDWVTLPIHEVNQIRSFIGVPIKARGLVIGFLNLQTRVPNFFTSAHVERVKAFADQAAIAVENAQLYDELYKYATELKQRVAERTTALSAAKDHLEAILLNSSDAIVETSIDGLLDQKNPAFMSLFGYQPDEARGQSVTFLAAPDYQNRLLEMFRQVVNDVQPAHIEIVACRRDNTFFDAEMAISPIAGPDGRTMSVVCSVRDISAHKLIEKELQDLNHLKTEFLSTAAHELRTPLTSIRGFSEIILTRELDTERQRRYVRLINEQGTQLGQLIDDLLDISRLEAKRGLSLQLESMNLDELLNSVSTTFIESAPKHQIRIESLEDSGPALIADAFRLAQVLKNLLSNAVKYSPKGGMITVRCQALAAEIVVSVHDQGIGMTPEQQTHLFEKFYRADASSTAIGGTGLGLAISKLIVELHGGRMWFESAYGIGTAFYFTLPLAGHQLIPPGITGANP